MSRRQAKRDWQEKGRSSRVRVAVSAAILIAIVVSGIFVDSAGKRLWAVSLEARLRSSKIEYVAVCRYPVLGTIQRRVPRAEFEDLVSRVNGMPPDLLEAYLLSAEFRLSHPETREGALFRFDADGSHFEGEFSEPQSQP